MVVYTYVNLRNDVVRESRLVFDDCYRFDEATMAATESLSDVAADIPLINEDFAQTFGMSFDAANAFVASMRREAFRPFEIGSILIRKSRFVTCVHTIVGHGKTPVEASMSPWILSVYLEMMFRGRLFPTSFFVLQKFVDRLFLVG